MRILLLALFAAGCGGSFLGDEPRACTAIFDYGLTVSVIDSQSGAPLCGATVTATDGAYVETLQRVPIATGAAGCGPLVGAGERAGTYSLVASEAGAQKTAPPVTVTKDACHVQGQSVTIAF
jgi:hypothetical protein